MQWSFLLNLEGKTEINFDRKIISLNMTYTYINKLKKQ